MIIDKVFKNNEIENNLDDLIKDEIYEDEKRILKVYKLKNNFNIDLILTNINKINYIDAFDINLCKAYIPIINKDIKYKVTLPNSCKELISKINFSPDFILDVANKKITLNLPSLSEKRIFSSIEHLERIKEKYSDFSLNLMKSNNNEKEKIYENALILNKLKKDNFNTLKEMKKNKI